jgi:hypothetical protein
MDVIVFIGVFNLSLVEGKDPLGECQQVDRLPGSKLNNTYGILFYFQ